ncbi:MAG: hypothetical protein HKN04_06480 [Rhodothermaceae bacterium]|nr:hypothetical protein [Rhodothermaceae bacterium]
MTAIRPPEYFPRLDYAALLLAADRFVLADTFPFSRQGHQNRMRIRTPDGQGWQWLTVPRVHAQDRRRLDTVPLDDATPWVRRHRRALHVNYSMTPFYDHYRDSVDALLKREWASLGDLACATVAWAHEHLGGEGTVVQASQLPGAPDDLVRVWTALDDADALGTLPESAETDATQLIPHGATVQVLRFDEHERRQNFPGFVGGVSVLDLLFNYGPAAADLLREGVTGWRVVSLRM